MSVVLTVERTAWSAHVAATARGLWRRGHPRRQGQWLRPRAPRARRGDPPPRPRPDRSGDGVRARRPPQEARRRHRPHPEPRHPSRCGARQRRAHRRFAGAAATRRRPRLGQPGGHQAALLDAPPRVRPRRRPSHDPPAGRATRLRDPPAARRRRRDARRRDRAMAAVARSDRARAGEPPRPRGIRTPQGRPPGSDLQHQARHAPVARRQVDDAPARRRARRPTRRRRHGARLPRHPSTASMARSSSSAAVPPTGWRPSRTVAARSTSPAPAWRSSNRHTCTSRCASCPTANRVRRPVSGSTCSGR